MNNYEWNTPFQRRRRLKRETAAAMEQGNCRLPLILAVLLLCFTCFAAVFAVDIIFSCIPLFLPAVDVYLGAFLIFEVAHLVLSVFLLLLSAGPLSVGIVGMAIKMCRGEAAGLAEIFTPFSCRKDYWRAVGLVWHVTVRFLPVIWCGYAATFIWNQFLIPDEWGLVYWISCLLLILGFTFLGLWLCSRNRGFAVIALEHPEIPLYQVEDMAKETTAGDRGWLLLYECEVLVKTLLSILPLGVIFILHTAPFSVLSLVNQSMMVLEKKK